jgi:hypothetical protein
VITGHLCTSMPQVDTSWVLGSSLDQHLVVHIQLLVDLSLLSGSQIVESRSLTGSPLSLHEDLLRCKSITRHW